MLLLGVIIGWTLCTINYETDDDYKRYKKWR